MYDPIADLTPVRFIATELVPNSWRDVRRPAVGRVVAVDFPAADGALYWYFCEEAGGDGTHHQVHVHDIEVIPGSADSIWVDGEVVP